MNCPSINVAAVEDASVRLDLFGFLAAIFNHRMDIDFIRTLLSTPSDILRIEPGIMADSPEINDGITKILAYIQASHDKLEIELETELAVDWTRLFRGVSPSYGPTPPYEELYVKKRGNTGQVLQQISRCYRESGITIGTQYPNRPDYIGIELDFLRIITERELEAWVRQDYSEALKNRETATTFLDNHLSQWYGDFCDAAFAYAKTDFFKGVLLLTRGLIAGESGSS